MLLVIKIKVCEFEYFCSRNLKVTQSQTDGKIYFSLCLWRSDHHVASAYQTIQNSQFFNRCYFSKFRGIKPKIDNLTYSTQLYPSLESKKVVAAI